MKIEWRADISLIVAALIVSFAAVTVAKIVAPKRYVPIGTGHVDGMGPVGLYLDTERGDVGLGPSYAPPKTK